MRYVLVNGRTPTPKSFCAWCCEWIATDYLREIDTRLSYCGPGCYAAHCNSEILLLENRAKTEPPERRPALPRG
jgi:hypothetical protein